MGNTVAGHICHIEVFRPYPVILYRLHPTLLYCIDSDWTPLSIGGKNLVSLGTSKFGVLGGKASTHV